MILVVDKSTETYREEGKTAYTNSDGEKNYAVKSYYPDVISQDRNGAQVIE